MKTTRTVLQPAVAHESGLVPKDPDLGVNWWDACSETLLIGLLAFMPFALGVVRPWSELVVHSLTAVLATIIALRLLVNPLRSFAWSWTYLPIALFLLLAACHLIPLPNGVLASLSASTVDAKSTLLEPAYLGDTGSTALTFYAHGTARALRLLLVPITLFVVTINLVQRPEQLKRLLAAIAVIGGAVTALALAQTLSGTTDIYWSLPMPGGAVARSGPFVNRGHFAQFTNLSIGASIGLLLIMFRESQAERWPTKHFGKNRNFESWVTWLIGTAIVAEVVAVALSLSRGGAVALLVALVSTVVLLSLLGNAGRRGPLLAGLLLAAFGAAIYFGYDAMYHRFTVDSGGTPYGERERILRDSINLFQQYPALGTGFGTFQFVFPMVDSATLGLVATHAENEYAQILVETGVVGLVIVVAFMAMIGRHFIANIRSTFPLAASAYGLGFGLIAAAVHSFTDFGQHFPAIGGLSAVLCGLLVSLSRMRRQASPARTATPARVALVVAFAA